MAERNEIERLFRRHYAQLYRLAAVLLHDDDRARDIVHDVFASLLDGRNVADVSESYLVRAVRNRCLNLIRDCDTHRRIANLYFIDNEEYDSEEWPDEETIARIQKLVSNDITEQSRRVMELRFGRGLPFSRVAVEMGISESAVYRHLSNALKIIRNKLSHD